MSLAAALYLESLTSAKEKNDILELRRKPENIITREVVREYYEKVTDHIFPYLKNRPQALKRDYSEQSLDFLPKKQKQVAYSFQNSPLPINNVFEVHDSDCIVCYTKETLEYINNLGCIEITPWHSSIENLENPDYLVIAIEPSKRNTFFQAVRVAKTIKAILDKCGATGFCKTAGDSGLHIYIPVGKKYPYRLVREFAYNICLHTNIKLPELTSLKKEVAQEGQKIFLNYQTNRRGQTIVAPYSLRPYSWAPVSTPLLWSELKDDLNPFDFNIITVPARLEKFGDLFAGIFEKGVNIEDCMKALQYE